jgi:hypothetical protein
MNSDEKIMQEYRRLLKGDVNPDYNKTIRLIKKAYNKVYGIVPKPRKITTYNLFVREHMPILSAIEREKVWEERRKPTELMKEIGAMWRIKKEIESDRHYCSV